MAHLQEATSTDQDSTHAEMEGQMAKPTLGVEIHAVGSPRVMLINLTGAAQSKLSH